MGCAGSKVKELPENSTQAVAASPAPAAKASPPSASPVADSIEVKGGDPELAAVAQSLIGDDNKTQSPGACCAILSAGDGKCELRMAVAGVRQHASENPVQEGDVWHIGSCTKAMTATLVAVLVDHGEFPGYDATVGQIAAAAGDLDPCSFAASHADVTMEQLLCHTGSIPGEICQTYPPCPS